MGQKKIHSIAKRSIGVHDKKEIPMLQTFWYSSNRELATLADVDLLLGAVPSVSLLRFYHLNHIHSFNYLAQHHMPLIQPWSLTKEKEQNKYSSI
jgi:hypothetical protein